MASCHPGPLACLEAGLPFLGRVTLVLVQRGFCGPAEAKSQYWVSIRMPRDGRFWGRSGAAIKKETWEKLKLGSEKGR